MAKMHGQRTNAAILAAEAEIARSEAILRSGDLLTFAELMERSEWYMLAIEKANRDARGSRLTTSSAAA